MTRELFNKIIEDIEDHFEADKTFYLIADGNQYLLSNWIEFTGCNLQNGKILEDYVFILTKGSIFYMDLALVQGIRIVREPEDK